MSGVLVLLGGVLGALLIWWLDGRRIASRERRELIGALELVSLELANNMAQAEYWLPPLDNIRVIELRWEAWSAHQATIARSLPRDVVARVGIGYELARALMYNLGVAKTRGRLIEDDVKLARRTRDRQLQSLRELQSCMRTKLKIHFTQEPTLADAGDPPPGDRPA